MNLADRLYQPVFHTVGATADSMGRECYVVGGYVRDLFLHRNSKDIDFVTVGSGIEVATEVAKALGRGAHCNVFRNFGTAQVKKGALELEFVGARRESYQRDSRKPIVEDGSLDDDLSRRDFTINAMAISVNASTFGNLIDPFDGLSDLDAQIIRTPLDPDITFSDDPLRMMRAIRFATQLGFTIDDTTFDAIVRKADRIEIISRERIADELMKIMASPVPSTGWELLSAAGLLKYILPELEAMKGVETVGGRGHKDNFLHTMAVLDKVASKSNDVWLRWAALFHDIAKPATKRWDARLGWTFHNHNFIGAKMIPGIFRRMRLPMNEKMKFVQKIVELHMRPIALVEDTVTDSAVRRLLFDAGDDIDALMTLCGADITSRNADKVRRHLANFELVRQKMAELEERDRIRCFQPPVAGEEIMSAFSLTPCREVGLIKDAIKNAILDGIIPNDRIEALKYMYLKGQELNLTPSQPIITE
ncbi:MAG: CCA tRNA nucleotidyltransferase [Muribaculum sp.]|nr:CCA tRNA nucleotidyltransferase [Muribaculum sp.]